MLFRNAWSGVPDGADADFTVLAVMQPAAAQTTGIGACEKNARVDIEIIVGRNLVR
jgi:hypothetical protein